MRKNIIPNFAKKLGIMLSDGEFCDAECRASVGDELYLVFLLFVVLSLLREIIDGSAGVA